MFDALTHKRPYKEAWPIDEALDEIRRLDGTQFDPELTRLFLALAGRLRAEHADLDRFLGQAASATPFMRARGKIQRALHRGHHPEPDTAAGGRLDSQR